MQFITFSVKRNSFMNVCMSLGLEGD